jgi:putative endonuclease
VYILFSEGNQLYYKGETCDVSERLEAHNTGRSQYTKNKGPWKLIFVESHPDRKSALKREKQIKRLNQRSIQKLISSEVNIVNQFIL